MYCNNNGLLHQNHGYKRNVVKDDIKGDARILNGGVQYTQRERQIGTGF